MLVGEIFKQATGILGFCDEEKVFQRLTMAVEMLSKKGNWNPLIGYVDLCTRANCNSVTLPREIDTPLALNICGRPAYARSKWFEFHLNGPGSNSCMKWSWDDAGETPTFMDIIKPSLLLAIADLKTDIKAILRVFGYDENGRFIRTQNPDGTWIDGVEIPINKAADFQLGILMPNEKRMVIRNFKAQDINTFVSSDSHEFVTGAGVVVSLVTPPLPVPIQNGSLYYVRKISDTEVSLHYSVTGALSGIDQVIITSAAPSSELIFSNKRQVKVLTKFNSATPHNLKNASIVEFEATTFPAPILGNTEYFAHVIDDNNFTAHASASDADTNTNPIDVSNAGANITVLAKQAIAPKTKLTFSVNHNFLQGDSVRIVNSSGSLPEPLLEGVDYYVRVLSSKEITLHNTLADATTGIFPITITSSGSGINSVVKTIPCSISLGNASNCTAINHNLTQTGGDFVQFSTNGILPTPLTQNTAYRAEPPMSDNTFTINTTAPAPVDITDLGSGQHFLLISRVFSIGFLHSWETDAESLVNGTAVKIESDGSLPATDPAISPATTYYARKVDDFTIELFESQAYSLDASVRNTTNRERSSNTATLTVPNHGFSNLDYVNVFNMGDSSYNAARVQINVIDTNSFSYPNPEADEVNTNDVSGHVRRAPISVLGVGTGNLNLLIERAVTALLDSPYFRTSLDYLAEGTTVQFETNGTLPSPLVVGNEYKIDFVDGLISITNLNDIPIPLTSIGSGTHYMAINRLFTIDIPTDVEVLNNIYENGDEVLVQSTGTLPTPLVSQKYYLRYVDEDSVEIYDTKAHALDAPNVIGRITILNTGTGVHSFYQEKEAFYFSKVTRVEKSVTDGMLALYAFDDGRCKDLTLIGYYEPSETAPSYRRIKIGQKCAWIRMRFRKRIFKISSKLDFIPLKNTMAILMMLKSINFFLTDFFDQARDAEAQALRFLEEENNAEEGPFPVTIQFNDNAYFNSQDQYMT